MPPAPKRTRRLLHDSLMAFKNPFATIDAEAIPVRLPGLPPAFIGARIAVVADVHLPDCAVSVPRLVRAVALQRPDAIFLAGDLTNSYARFDEEGLRALSRGLCAVAPCFAIPGNHELRLEREECFAAVLRAAGAVYLSDESTVWRHGGDWVPLYGMGHRCPHPLPPAKDSVRRPVIALAHKPEYFSYYQRARFDLVVCGHAHGGQMRIAGRGLYAPGQGLLPAYTGGVYREGGTTMVVSRGLGDSSVPLRLHNRAHLPLLLLFPSEEEG